MQYRIGDKELEPSILSAEIIKSINDRMNRGMK